MNDFVLSPGGRTAPEVETASRDPQLARLATRLSSVLAAEQLRLDEEMHETRHFLASIFDNIPNVILVKDARTLRFVRVNAAAERLLGYREYEMQSKTDHDLFPKAQADYFEATDRAALASGEQVLVPAEAITCKDGSTRLLQTKKFTIRDQDGSPLYLLGMAEDITERALAEQRLRDSERQYRQLIEQASDGIFISDADGNFLIVNTRGCELLGYRREEMIGMNGKVTYVDSELDLHTARMRAVTEGQELRYERLVKRKDGSTFPAEISLKRLEGGLVQVIFHDISKRREQERRIARLSRIQAVQSGINSAIVRIRDRQELLNEACRIATTIASFPIAWIGLIDPATGTLEPVASAGLDKSFFLDLARSQGRSAFAPAGVGTRSIAQGRTIVDNDILAEPDIDGVRRMAVACGCRSAIGLPLVMDGAAVGTMMFYGAEQDFFDAAEVKLLEELASDVSFALTFIAQQEKVEFLAYYDPVTGLPNRSLFFDKLSRQIAAAEQSGNGVALILIDLNRFRLINDTLGRKAGDALLDAVARRLGDAARPDEAIARVGSNRFALAIPGHWADGAAVSGIEARCHACFERTFLIEGEELRISASAGVAVHPMHAADAESLYANAEAALRNAQAENLPVQYYGPEMNARVAESLHLENRLKRALANDELVLWYQPKVDIATGRLQGFEALMRWNDPETGLVSPGKFIPLMEQTGLILDAGRWALTRVAEDCRQWAKPGGAPLRIAVNVSPLQLRQRDFVATVIDAAARTEEAGCALDLEITESAIMQNVEAIVPKLQTIRGLGVEISIDDFGTGYSSLAYVARLPIHALKIDRSFVVGMTQSEDSLAIVRSVISLAHSLRLSVIAEGVETPGQEALLRALACDEMQGYRISPPLPPEQIRDFILARA